jgi:hypothetical protein
LQFWGLGEGENNGYGLSGLTLRADLKKQTFVDLSSKTTYEADYNELCNRDIRTMVIRNWKDTNFLHTVFLRLNTGSVNLSPQELRQALLPGPFSDYIDDAAGQSQTLQSLLGTTGPDPRMRDIEILARFIAFRFFAEEYPGRMKKFLDNTFDKFNKKWRDYEPHVSAAKNDFENGVDELIKVFGEKVARKPTSPQFNRAIFDALIFFHSQPAIRRALSSKRPQVKKAYDKLFGAGSNFLKAVESDTAGAPNTSARLRIWAAELSRIAGQTFGAPKIPIAPIKKRSTAKRSARKASHR